jgi:pimeloyl-ACP methyl ester carboxylesterase
MRRHHLRAQALAQTVSAAAPRGGRVRRWVLWAYLILLAASHVYQEMRNASPALGGADVLATMSVPRASSTASSERMAYREWLPRENSTRHSELGTPNADAPPVILIHGSPGSGYEFRKLAPLIAASGYRVIAVDLPGFGQSSRNISDHSMRTHAQRVLTLMDSLHIDRAHILGWSNGGGVVLNMANMAPQRFASLTMLAAVGDQAREGSGSYAFEHAKYALGLATFGGVPALIPHFGKLGTFADRTDFLLNFWDSDQRPLKGIMQRLTIPTLILHGRQDCLVHAQAAEEHHQLIKTSSLVMLRANHFLPLAQASQTSEYLVPFLKRHDAQGVAAQTSVTDLSPEPELTGLAHWGDLGRKYIRDLPWWAQVSAIGKLVLIAPTIGVVTCAALVVSMDVDFLVAIAGIVVGLLGQTALLVALGAILGKRMYKVPWLGRRLDSVSIVDWSRRMRRTPAREGWVLMFIARSRTSSLLGAVLCRPGFWPVAKFVLARVPAILVWAIVSFIVAVAGMMALHYAWPHVGMIRLLLAGGLLAIVVRAMPMLLVTRGRHALAGWWERIVHYEYWPIAVFYIPLVPYIAWLTLKHRGLTVLTCCNPGIEKGGGLIGESKHDIMTRLSDGLHRIATVLVDAGPTPAERAQLVRDAMSRVPGLGAFPVVIKPDAGQRGFAVRVIKSDDQLEPYFEMMPNAAVVQPYHPGPHECGVLWARCPRPTDNGQAGFIYSITRKDFPELIGDGLRTVEELIYAHPRYRRQVDVFLDRFPDLASRVLDPGETLRLGAAGNHCQGALFRDGSDLITPGLSAAIDRLARDFKGGLDFGRFDLRYASEDALAAGDFAVVELNGTSSESTNLYDPDKSIFWAYRVLMGQWKLLFELGARRRAQGARSMPLAELIASIRAFYSARRGSALAD